MLYQLSLLHNRTPRSLTPLEMIWLYSWWSEEYYAAGFISPSEEFVSKFRKWLHEEMDPNNKLDNPFQDYEMQMVVRFTEQEADCEECLEKSKMILLDRNGV